MEEVTQCATQTVGQTALTQVLSVPVDKVTTLAQRPQITGIVVAGIVVECAAASAAGV